MNLGDPLGLLDRIFDPLKRDIDRVASSVTSLPLPGALVGNPGIRVEENLLTPAQHEVLALAAEGLSNREIADKLGIAIGTVRVHLSDIRQLVGVPTREGAVAAFGKPTIRKKVPISVLRALRKAEERPRVVGVMELLEMGEDMAMAMLRPRVVLTEKEKEGVISEFQEIMGREPTRREIDELFSEELRLKRATPGT